MPKLAVTQHDDGLAPFRVLDPRPIRCAETLGKVRPGLRKKVRVNVDRWHVLSSWMHGSAMFAAAQFLVAVEPLKNWRQVANDALEPQLRPMHAVMTIRAIPLEGIEFTLGARHLDHHP